MGNNKISHIYEVNTRIWLRSLSDTYNKRITLADIPEQDIADIKELGFDAVWLMGIWSPSKKSKHIARRDKNLLNEAKEILPDFKIADIGSSPYSIAGYEINSCLGNKKSVLDFKKRLNSYGIKLILDFVPNHLAIDHPWIRDNPSLFINGSKKDLREHPELFFIPDNSNRIIAYGKDPYFPPWRDVAQLNYFNPQTQEAMQNALLEVSSLCDGVRCDMAMLILKKIQKGIWGNRVFCRGRFKKPRLEFWQRVIPAVKKVYPDFIFIAEVYWDLEDKLISFGFDYAYDKVFYDLLVWSDVERLRARFKEEKGLSCKKIRFIENHDEPRAAKVFTPEKEKAAALLTALTDGSHLFHQGQLEGFKVKLPVQLLRQPTQETDEGIRTFYENLFLVSRTLFHKIQTWQVLEPLAAWDKNSTNRNFIALFNKRHACLIAVNYSNYQSQCYLHFDIKNINAQKLLFKDISGPNAYIREKQELLSKGFYLDITPYAFHVFTISPHISQN